MGIPRKRVLIYLDGSGWIWLADLLVLSLEENGVFFGLGKGPRSLFVWDLVMVVIYMECTIV